MHSTSKSKTLLLIIVISASFSLHGMDNFDNELRERNVKRSKCVLLYSVVFAGIGFFTQALNPVLYHQPDPAPAQEPEFTNNLQAHLISQQNIEQPLLFEKNCIRTIRSSNYCYDVWAPRHHKKRTFNKKRKKRR